MRDLIFLKHTIDMEGDGRGMCGGYTLGALFCVRKKDYNPSNEYQRVRRLHTGKSSVSSCSWNFNVMNCEVEVVNNDVDLNLCIESYNQSMEEDYECS